VYGGAVRINVVVPKKVVATELRVKGLSFENTVYKLLVGDEMHLVTPRQAQINASEFLSS
jgi:hypothetical protein